MAVETPGSLVASLQLSGFTTRRSNRLMRFIGAASIVFVLAMAFAVSGFAPATQAGQRDSKSAHDGNQTLRDGQQIFRFDTFGDEQLWTDVLRMHEVIPTGDPVTALAVGQKVDLEALPRKIVAA